MKCLQNVCAGIRVKTVITRQYSLPKLSAYSNYVFIRQSGSSSGLVRHRNQTGLTRRLAVEGILLDIRYNNPCRVFSTSPERVAGELPDATNSSFLRRPIISRILYICGISLVSLSGVVVALYIYWRYHIWKWRSEGLELIYNKSTGSMPIMLYKGTVLFALGIRYLKNLDEFQARDDDVFVTSYPRSGTTWTQEIVYLLKNNIDTEKAQEQHLQVRFPFYEEAFRIFKYRIINRMTSPRLIKSHVPYFLLPSDVRKRNVKIIYITRDPRDVMVSLYHHYQDNVVNFTGTFKELLNYFLTDSIIYTPWDKHVLSYWERRNDDNVLFLRYEDMKQDFKGSIRKIAEFLGKSVTEEDVSRIAEHCSFKSMSNNKTVNSLKYVAPEGTFIRKGVVGQWTQYFDEEMEKQMDAYINERFAGTDYKIRTEETYLEKS